MLRLTEIKLPLDHPADALHAAILKKLGIAATDMLSFSIAKRSYDARKKNEIVFIYSLDVQLKNESSVLNKLHGDRHVTISPDTTYQFVAQAPASASHPTSGDRHGSCRFVCCTHAGANGFPPYRAGTRQSGT